MSLGSGYRRGLCPVDRSPGRAAGLPASGRATGGRRRRARPGGAVARPAVAAMARNACERDRSGVPPVGRRRHHRVVARRARGSGRQGRATGREGAHQLPPRATRQGAQENREEAPIEWLLAARGDRADKAARRAVKVLTSCLREPPAKERKKIAKTLRGRAALEAWDQATAWMTPARRARVAKAVTAALERCADNPKALTWPDDYIELLGHSATRTDQRAIALLEEFRRMA